MSTQNHIVDFPVSLVNGTKPQVVGETTIFDLLKKATEDPQLIKAGKELRKAYAEDKAAYARLKSNQPGFVAGKFSYRSENNLIDYPPVMGFDFDALGESMSAVMKKIRQWKYTALALPSISGAGVRVFVETSATMDNHKETYFAICSELEKVAGVKKRTDIQESLKKAGFSPQEVKEIVKSRPHLDDVTSDVSRFWYYSGMSRKEIFVNNNRSVYPAVDNSKPAPAAPPRKISRTTVSGYDWEPTNEQKVDYCLSQLEAGRIDITGGIKQWHKIGHAMYDAFGWSGESYFLRACAMHPDFKESECKKEYDRVSRQKGRGGKATIASFYQACKDHGVTVDFKALRAKYGPAVPSKRLSPAPATPAYQAPEKSLNESERCVVATALTRPDYIEDIFDAVPKFGSYCFTEEMHRNIFKVIETLRLEGKRVSPAAVVTKSSYTQNPVSKEQLQEITAAAYYPSGVATNAILVFDAYRRSRLVEVADETRLRAAAGEDVEDLLSDIETKFSGVSDTGEAKTEAAMDALAASALARYEMLADRKANGGGNLTGVTTGNKGLDDAYGGRQPGHLYYKAGRPAMGKTMTVLNEALAAARSGVGVGILSLEMPSIELTNRLLAAISGLPATRISRAELSKSQVAILRDAANELSSLPIYIDDRGSQNAGYIKRQFRKWKRTKNIGLAILDYIQLADLGKGNSSTNDKVGALSKSLKQIAKDCDLPVVALSQLSRAVEARGGDKRPLMSDLRDSGNLEQDADGVEFCYRPEYYGIDEDQDGNTLQNRLVQIIAKNRHGEVRDCISVVDLECQRVTNPEDLGYSPAVVSSAAPVSDEISSAPEITEDMIKAPYGSHSVMLEAARAQMTPEDELPF